MFNNIFFKKNRGRMLDANAPFSALQCRYRYPQAPPMRLSLRHHEYIELKPKTQVNLKNIPIYP